MDNLFEEGPQKGDPVCRKWVAIDTLLISLLWNSMELLIPDTCMHMRTCKTVWEGLHEIYSDDITCMYNVFKEFFYLRQDNLSMIEYYGAFKKANEEMRTLMPLTTIMAAHHAGVD